MNTQPDFYDFSGNFTPLRRELWDSKAFSYKDFLKSLKPDYAKVRRDVLLGYLALLLTLAVTALLPAIDIWPVSAALIGAISAGYWVAYLQLFIHEGAHYNLAPERANSDRFCDRWISWMVGTNVASYRAVHFQHHKALGTPDDSEFSYFFPLNLVFFIKGLFGIRALEVILARKAMTDEATSKRAARPAAPLKQPPFNWGILAAPAIHGGIVVVTYFLGYWWVSLAWIIGVGMIFPLLGALRQILEHRDEEAMPGADFTKIPHGALTRIFPDGPFSSTFGGAGFNRHLLHHWEPTISYTNLPDFERFLEATPARAIVERRRSTYGATFLRLLSL